MSLKQLGFISIVGSTMLTSCSGSEDPRVSFCRSLAINLTQSSSEVVWQSQGHDIVRPEYAAVKMAAGEQRVVCYYEYEAVEESAIDHVDELDAYATLPYKVTINDAEVDKTKLAAAVKAEQIAALKATGEKVQQGFNAFIDKIKQLF